LGSQYLEAWERKLKGVFNEIDHYLEDKYGGLYPLHPARPKRGRTSNSSHDGLFNVGASYSLGIGSTYGEGYVVDVRMVTLQRVPEEVIDTIEEEVVVLLEQKLPEAFPDHKLQVELDGHVYKIFGDLDLGAL